MRRRKAKPQRRRRVSILYRCARPEDTAECIAVRGLTRQNAIYADRLARMGITVESWSEDTRSGAVVGQIAEAQGQVVGFCFGSPATGDLMKCQWQGWEIRLATGGIVEVGGYVGLPADKFLVDTDIEEGFTVNTEYPRHNDILLTVRRQGRRLAARVSGDEEALELGPSKLPMLLDVARQPSLLWTEDMPRGGLHIDVDARSLHYWLANPAEGIEDRVRRSCTGWQTEWLEDHFEEHLRLAAAA